MTPKLRGVASAFAKLTHGLEHRSSQLLDRIEAADKRGNVAFDKAHTSLDGTEQAVADVENFISSLDGANGGPTLGDSSTSPEEADNDGIAHTRRGQPV